MTDVYAEIDAICAPEAEGGNPGWCSAVKAKWLADLVLRERLTHCVEIGVFGGRSLLPVALAVKSLGRGGYVLGIDPYDVTHETEAVTAPDRVAWAGTVDYESVYCRTLLEIRRRGLHSHCGLLRAASDECAGLIGSVDLVHLDGCHSVLASCRDVETWLPKVRPGGWFVVDDVDWASVQPARAMVAAWCDPPVSVEAGWEAYRKR